MRIKLAGDPWIGTAESAGGTLAFPWGKGSRRLEVQYAVGVVEQNVTILLLALHDTEATSADKKVPSKTLRKAGEWGLVLAAKEAGKTLWEWLKDLF